MMIYHHEIVDGCYIPVFFSINENENKNDNEDKTIMKLKR